MADENEVVRQSGAIGDDPTVPTAAINVSIVVGGATYTLHVGIPTSTGAPYTMKLTETPAGQPQPQPQQIANFALKDSSNFLVDVNLPSITGNGVTVNAGFQIQEGNPMSAT